MFFRLPNHSERGQSPVDDTAVSLSRAKHDGHSLAVLASLLNQFDACFPQRAFRELRSSVARGTFC